MILKTLTPDNTLNIVDKLREARSTLARHRRAVQINPRDSISQHLIEVWEERVNELEDQLNGL